MSKKFQLGTFIKRVSRVLGFALSGFFSLPVFIGLACIVVTVLIVLRRQIDSVNFLIIANKWRPNFIEFTMLVHQSHYFTYAYFIPFLFFQGHAIDFSLLGPLFCIGWISYSLTPIIFGKQPTIRTLVIGHLLASATLFMIFWFSRSFTYVTLAWFFSGFGGGTVFCLTKLHKQEADNESDLDLWENIGHITGLIISLLIILISGRLNNVFLAAGFIAFLTALLLPLRLLITERTASTG